MTTYKKNLGVQVEVDTTNPNETAVFYGGKNDGERKRFVQDSSVSTSNLSTVKTEWQERLNTYHNETRIKLNNGDLVDPKSKQKYSLPRDISAYNRHLDSNVSSLKSTYFNNAASKGFFVLETVEDKTYAYPVVSVFETYKSNNTNRKGSKPKVVTREQILSNIKESANYSEISVPEMLLQSVDYVRGISTELDSLLEKASSLPETERTSLFTDIENAFEAVLA